MRKLCLKSVSQQVTSSASRKVVSFGGMALMQNESKAIPQHLQALNMADLGSQKLTQNHPKKRSLMRSDIITCFSAGLMQPDDGGGALGMDFDLCILQV